MERYPKIFSEAWSFTRLIEIEFTKSWTKLSNLSSVFLAIFWDQSSKPIYQSMLAQNEFCTVSGEIPHYFLSSGLICDLTKLWQKHHKSWRYLYRSHISSSVSTSEIELYIMIVLCINHRDWSIYWSQRLVHRLVSEINTMPNLQDWGRFWYLM